MKLTPAKKVKMRREIVPLVGEVNASEGLNWCVAKFEELKGLVDIDTILELFKMQGIVPFLIPDKTSVEPEEIQEVSEEEIEQREASVIEIPKRLTSVEYLEKKRIKDNKKQTKIKEDYKNMKDFWDRQEDPDEFQPFLKIKTKLTYTLELVDPESEPRPSVDSFGNDQYLFEVTLRNISPKKALDDTNKDGYPLYEIDRDYAFSVKKKGRSMKRFKALWMAEGPFTTFSFMRTGTGFQTDYVYKKVD